MSTDTKLPNLMSEVVDTFEALLNLDEQVEMAPELDASAEAELAKIDPHFWALTPRSAVDLGYLYYLEKEAESGNPNANAMYHRVKKTIQLMESEFDEYSTNKRAKHYITRLQNAAISYAQGLSRANKLYDEELALTIEKKARALSDCRWSAAGIGFLRSAGRLITMAVAVGSAALILVKLKAEVLESSAISPAWTAVFTAASTLLVTMYFEMMKIQKVGRETYIKFEHQKLKARMKRFRDVQYELGRALQMVRSDYRRILGRDPPSTDPAVISLAALADKHLQEDSTEFEEADRILHQSAFEQLFGFKALFWIKYFSQGETSHA